MEENNQLYTYDMAFDPITMLPATFDTPYIFYDGGVDIEYIYGNGLLPKRKKGKNGGFLAKKIYPEQDFIYLIFKSYIINYNKEKVTEYKINKKSNSMIKIINFSIKRKSPLINSKIIRKENENKIKIFSDIVTKNKKP